MKGKSTLLVVGLVFFVSRGKSESVSPIELSDLFQQDFLTTSRGGAAPTGGEMTNNIEYVFSDVDGTLVHYPENMDEHVGTKDNRIIKLPPSSTGMQGIISSATLTKCQQIRNLGKKLVIISGMRSTTLLKRIPYLPRADAYCCEAGGRIFCTVPPKDDGSPVFTPVTYDGATEDDLAPFSLEEDPEWRKKMESTVGVDGFVGNELVRNKEPVPVEERDGVLWGFCRKLQEDGFVIDTKGYSTCFRVNLKQQTIRSEGEFDQLLASKVPDDLATSVNLGCIDYYPADSGKKKCCQYLAWKFGGDADDEDYLSKSAVCLCDDDNDLEMALACSHAFVPGISSESMSNTIKANPKQITLTGGVNGLSEGTDATERALDGVLEALK